MTSEQEKQYIVAQRAMGKSFAQIGRELGRGESSIRYVFNHCMSKEPKPDETTPRMVMGTKIPGAAICNFCGKVFTKSTLGGKRSLCSDHCRNDWCNEQKRHTPYSRVCEQCGREFTAFGNPHKRFCSRKCFANSQKVARAGQYKEMR